MLGMAAVKSSSLGGVVGAPKMAISRKYNHGGRLIYGASSYLSASKGVHAAYKVMKGSSSVIFIFAAISIYNIGPMSPSSIA